MPKNWCFWTVVLKETLESPLDCKEIQPVDSQGNQSWIFIGRTNAEAGTLKLWPPDMKSWLLWKDPDAGKDWGQEENGTTEDEMVGWHHQLDGHGFGWTRDLVMDREAWCAACGSRGRKKSDTTERLNWTVIKKTPNLKKSAKMLQSRLILCDLIHCSPPGSSVHEDSPDKNTGVGCHALLQGVFLTQELNPHLLDWQGHSLPLASPGKLPSPPPLHKKSK